MEIQQLRHLLAAIQYGNLLKAADECNISQSGLSRSVRSLEERLGVQLLVRNSKGVEPTIYGLSIVQRAQLILNEVKRATDELKSIQASEVGDVTFGVTQNYGYYFVPEILAEMNQVHPNVRVNVVTGGFLDLLDRLKSGELDFAFGLLGPIDDSSEITIQPLRDHYSRVVARSSHPLAMKDGEVTPEELGKARWATLRGEGFQRIFIEYFSTHGLKAPTQAVRTDSIALIRQLVAQSDMVAVLPPDVVLDAVEAGVFKILDCEAPAEQTQVGLLFRMHSFVTPQSQQIIDRIQRRLSR